jgi:hypothetical protein
MKMVRYLVSGGPGKNKFFFQFKVKNPGAGTTLKKPEVTSLDWKSQCLENPSVPLLWLADKKSSIY